MLTTRSLLLMLLASISFFACQKDEKTPLAIPETYLSPEFSTNTPLETGYANALNALVNEAKKGRTTGTVVDAAQLENLYKTGGLDLITTPYYNGRLIGANGFFGELAKASGNVYTPGSPSGQGGTLGGYLFDENGLEMEQMIEKGLFAAAFYNYATTLMSGEISPKRVDQLIAIYGAHPDFPNTPTAGKAANPDRFMANYVARRDKNDGQGMYTQMKKHFITLRAAVEAGEKYNEERDAALEGIQLTWEKINAATVVNYCHSVISTMSATNTSDADKAKALHAYGECVGFLHGWRTVSADFKVLSDAEIDQLLVLLNAPYNTTPTSYTFVTDPVNQLPKLTQIITTLQQKFGFTNQEIEDFKNNWVAVQGR
ncbi:MAG: DUF4856 domain-containing protein [Chitinophagales bacterium]|nr:DUF4856 domain-containing protein [Chitinophagales bacterium]